MAVKLRPSRTQEALLGLRISGNWNTDWRRINLPKPQLCCPPARARKYSVILHFLRSGSKAPFQLFVPLLPAGCPKLRPK